MTTIILRILYLAVLFTLHTNTHAAPVQLPTTLTHTLYSFNQNKTFYNIDIYITWNQEPTPTTDVYAGYQFEFENGGGGYMGTQIDKYGKKIIFSIWDIDDQSITALPLADCVRFGHEGSGASCIKSYDWVAGREYMIRVWMLDKIAGGANWGGWIKDTVTGQETSIGAITLKDSKSYSGYGWLKPSGIGFLEHYGAGFVDDCNVLPYTKITWRGPYGNNGDYASNTAISNFVSTQCFNSDIPITKHPIVIMESGNNANRTNYSGNFIWNVSNKFILDEKSDCLFDWAKISYPKLFSLEDTPSFNFESYYARHFIKTNTFLGESNQRLFYYEPLANELMLDLGDISTWYRTAQCQFPTSKKD